MLDKPKLAQPGEDRTRETAQSMKEGSVYEHTQVEARQVATRHPEDLQDGVCPISRVSESRNKGQEMGIDYHVGCLIPLSTDEDKLVSANACQGGDKTWMFGELIHDGSVSETLLQEKGDGSGLLLLHVCGNEREW